LRDRALVIGLYAALTLALTWPVGISPAGHRMGGGADPSLYVWTIGWGAHALTSKPWAIFDANIFHPWQHTLAYSENLIGDAILAAPIIWLTDDPLAATNLIAVFTIFLSAIGGYWFGRTLGLSKPAAFLTGLIFAFTPPRFARLPQLHMTSIHWVPFALAFLQRYWTGGRARDLQGAVGFLSLQALTSGHGAALLVLGTTLLSLWHLAAGAPLALFKRVRDIGVVGVLLLLPAALAYIPYAQARRDVPLARVLDDVGVTAVSWVSSPSHLHQWLLAAMPDWDWIRAQPDAYLFPGLVPLALALCAFVGGRTTPDGRRWRWLGRVVTGLAWSQLAIAIAVAVNDSFILRIGGVRVLSAHGWQPWAYTLVLFGIRWRMRHHAPLPSLAGLTRGLRTFAIGDVRWFALGTTLFTIWMSIGPPWSVWQWLYWMPGLNFIRVPSRFTLLGFLTLAVLAGLGADRLWRRCTPHLRHGIVALLSVLCIVEFQMVPVDSRPFTLDIPEVDRWLNSQSKPFVVAEVPVSDSRDDSLRADHTVRYMLHTLAHFQPTVLGYSGVEPADYRPLYNSLIDFPNDDAITRLRARGVTWVVVHMEHYPASVRATIDARLRATPALVLAHEDAHGGRAYRLTPAGQ
jgi:hypothetical protein